MSEHTKGRLSVVESRVYYANCQGGFDLRKGPDAEANVRRLAACWNACEGISTENLEENLPLVDGLRSLNGKLREANGRIAQIEAITQQQDALLAKKACATKECRELLAARALLREVRENGVWSSDNGINFAEARELEARIDSYLDACDTLEGKPNAN